MFTTLRHAVGRRAIYPLLKFDVKRRKENKEVIYGS
jgi:hypothetical protein